jgi:pimeloyl-ACP methyl ester carboxylesterase
MIPQREDSNNRPARAARAGAAATLSRMHNLLIFFGGYWEAGSSGGPLTRPDQHGDVRSSAAAFDAIAPLFKERCAVNSALDNSTDNQAVRAGHDFLSSRLEVQGKVVLYGFSAGAFNAIRLAERIAGDPRMHRRRIDLLITVDPCLQLIPGHESFSTQTPWAVLRHINYYQLVDEFRGRSIPGAAVNEQFGEGTARPRNAAPDAMRLPGRFGVTNHDRMPLITLDRVAHEIRACLDPKALRNGWRPH